MPMKLRTCMLALLAPLVMPVWSADDLMTQYFVDQAHEWEQKDRPDLALEIWQKVLLGTPNHPEALRKLRPTTGKNKPPPALDLPPQPVVIKSRPAGEPKASTVQTQTTRPATKALAPKLAKVKTEAVAPAPVSTPTQTPDATSKQTPVTMPEPAIAADQPAHTAIPHPVVLPKLERLKLKPSDTLELSPAARSR